MSTTLGNRALRVAAELCLGDEVSLDAEPGLVVRVYPTRSEVMVELWTRGSVEHRVHFLAPDQLVEHYVGPVVGRTESVSHERTPSRKSA